MMPLKCPLCLKSGVAADQFRYFCMHHAQSGELQSVTFRCPDCQSSSVRAGVFVSHVGCLLSNPFFDVVSKVVKEINQDGESIGALAVAHWELAMLARAKSFGADQPEMWFPLALLQACNRESSGTTKIKLVGAKKAGKTTLASLALRLDSYRENPTIGGVEAFIYAEPAAGATEAAKPFLEALHVANVFDGKPQTTENRLMPNIPRTTSVRAAFFAQSKTRKAKRARGILAALKENVFSADVTRAAAAREVQHYRTAVFYDFAGEEFEREINHLKQSQASLFVDVIAVVVDASDISTFKISPEADKPNSLDTAVVQLQNMIRGPRGRECVLVTKLDKVGHTGQPSPEDARNELIGWLSKSIGNSAIEASLQSLLSTRQIPTFFIQMEHLRESGNSARAIGVDSWLTWCFRNALEE
jgi:hypothetical protein